MYSITTQRGLLDQLVSTLGLLHRGVTVKFYPYLTMEIAPPPPDPPPGGGRMPHTHYGPVMGVAPNPYNTRSKKRARHGESYTEGAELIFAPAPPYVDDGEYINLLTRTSMMYEVEGFALNPRNFPPIPDGVTWQQIGMSRPYYSYQDFGVEEGWHQIRTTNTVPVEHIAVGRPVTQTGFRIELPDFLGDPFDPTSRYGPRGSYSGKEWTPR